MASAYLNAGVNVDIANSVKAGFAALLEKKGVTLSRKNAFAAIVDPGFSRFKDPVLVLKSEEPGSKQLFAFENDHVESVCFDMINHLVNDCVCCGAEPVAIQDVIICGTLEAEIVKRIVIAISDAAKQQGCFLSGGETSEQPDVLPRSRYVLSSSIVGIIERDRIVDGRSIAEGDVIVGLGSSGLHTNGYSLVRRVLADNPGLLETEVNGRPVLDVLLDVHRPYYPALKPLFEMKAIKGAAHITGGGIAENLNRILPNNVDAAVRLERYRPAAIFNLLREAGSISDADMLRTFNLGVGMALVVSSDELEATLNSLKQSGCPAFEIGSIVPGSGHVQLRGHIGWR